MGFLGAILRFLLIAGAALLGNYVGDFLARPAQSRMALDMGLTHDRAASAITLNVRPTNFLPAVGLALLAGPPRVLYAFVSGVVISMLIGDRYESAF